MFLKCLDIFGFKSFADHTHIDFSSGITALLGPNGCGKSNVVDAMKWVLAEGKSKNLRAEKMEDVIFAGTSTRPALNVAEVALTIVNENSLLPVDDTEVEIKRRLYRSGEAQYFINNRQVGPTEIRKLFMDTGVGKAAYSVMEQGKIDQILSSKPEDRRYLFEEAAGISRSKAECAEAERELERTRQNLSQIEASLGEIKKSYETLKVQADKTTKFRKAKEEYFNISLDLQLLRLKDFIETKARNETSLKEVEEKRNTIRKEIEEITNSISENSDKIQEMQETVYALQQDLVKIQTEKDAKLDFAKQQNIHLAEIKEKISTLEIHKKTIQNRIDDLNEEVGDAQSNLFEKKKYLEEIKRNITALNQNIQTASAKITENDVLVTNRRKEITDLDAARADLQKELTAITEDIVTMLDAKLKDAGYSQASMNSAKEKLDEITGKLRVLTEGRKNIFQDFAKKGCQSTEEGHKIGTEAAAAFEEANKLVLSLQDALDNYISASPSFISEFLAPEGIITKKRAIDTQINENLEKIASINKTIEGINADNTNLAIKIDEDKDTLRRYQVQEGQMDEQITGTQEKIEILGRSIRSEELTLKNNEDEIYSETHRLESTQEMIESIQDELDEIEQRGRKTVDELNVLNNEIDEFRKKASGKENDLKKKQDQQDKFQSEYERLSISLGKLDTEIHNVKQNFIDSHSRDLSEFEEHMYTITASPTALREKLDEVKANMESLGRNVNLMAPEEFAETKDRYERQQSSYDDTLKTLQDLVRVSEEIRSKSSEMFLNTYNLIKRNFYNMFRRLFGGGHAELKLDDPQNVLTTGIQILAQPPGKKLENIALLSGGEKTMTAIALLFATYQVRPSPFCLLDEIDAALDDKNVSSFVNTLRSFANISQYIVITHNRKTVLGAGTMLGVTMEESGVSKTIALRLDDDVDKIKSEVLKDNDDFVEEDVPPEEGTYIPPRPAPRNKNAQQAQKEEPQEPATPENNGEQDNQ
ncbi:MAG: AAA family ATPase [Treponema sp.]|nr:AAA family ATPase [Treponema sp.]